MRFALEHLKKCSQAPPEIVPRGTLGPRPREHPERPGKGTEKDHSVQQVNNGHSVGNSSRKWGVGSILDHSPISLTLPLSSFGWLRNNSSSHSPSASFRNHRAVGDSSRKCRVANIRSHSPISLTLPLSSPKGDGFAATPARAQCELP